MKRLLKKFIYYLLRQEAKLILWKYRPKIVAITGSVGKTSTKDAIFAMLSRFAYVRKAEKSYNTQVGIPLTIIGCPNGWNNLYVWFQNLLRGLKLILLPSKYPEWIILEVGVGKPDDMKTTASWFKTDIVIMTAIGQTPVHVEFFSSRKHLVEEKSKLINTLKKDGILILNSDDATVLDMKERTKNRIVTYGFNEGADVSAGDLSIDYDKSSKPKGLIFRVEAEGNSLPVAVEGVFGQNHAYATLATLSFSYAIDLNLVKSIDALKDYEPPPGRMVLLAGINESFIIDDSYNSSPFACQSALETLSEVNGQEQKKWRKIAVLGDMLELGRHTKEEHEKIGLLAKKSVDVLVAVGPRAKHIIEGAQEAKMAQRNIFEFNNSREAGDFLKDFIQKDDLVLIKGSQGMRMERTVEKVLLGQKNKADLLVRQEPEWLAKE